MTDQTHTEWDKVMALHSTRRRYASNLDTMMAPICPKHSNVLIFAGEMNRDML